MNWGPHRKHTVETTGRGLVDITSLVKGALMDMNTLHGLCNVFCHHTSASLIITENADPDVLRDLETLVSRLVPDGDPAFRHDAEGPDDMPAHVRSVLTTTSLNIPIVEGRLALGTWQGIFLWEHRTAAHQRTVSVTIVS